MANSNEKNSDKTYFLENLPGLDPCRPETWPLWMHLGEVAAVLRLSPHTVRDLGYCGDLRTRKFGRQIRFARASVMELTDMRKVG